MMPGVRAVGENGGVFVSTGDYVLLSASEDCASEVSVVAGSSSMTQVVVMFVAFGLWLRRRGVLDEAMLRLAAAQRYHAPDGDCSCRNRMPSLEA